MEQEFWRNIAKATDATQHGLRDEEFKHVSEVLGRSFSILELGIISALYSEHCSYKSTRMHLKNLPTKGPKVLIGPGENAGVIDIGDGQAVVFKVESHNHPTYIEPFQGAATGVGGIMRDVFTMGARPLALMNALRFGAPENPRTAHLFGRAVAGIGHYGNCMGVPTVGGELFFHKAYDGNCLVNAFCLGLVDVDKIFLGKASGVGNQVFYVGSKTGRDGIRGANMASEAFDENAADKRPTVQVGDPFQEKLLLEACLEVMRTGAIVGMQDMGAAGFTSSSYEMASRGSTGLRLWLDRVPQRETNMNPYEIMLSESQERMLLIVENGREADVFKVFSHWELDVVQVGEVIEGNNVELFWNGELVSSLPADLLTNNVPQIRWKEAEPADYKQRLEFDFAQIAEPNNLSAVWLKLLGSINLCSRLPVYRQYDSTVRGNTVIQGGDAALIRIKNYAAREKGIAMTLDCNSRFCAIDPKKGTALSIAEACRNLTAVGAEPIGISDNLNFSSPERPEGMWEIAESVRGMADAARAFEVPIISGNVSLYNETKGRGILPTPLIAMVGLMADVSKAVGTQFKNVGDRILVLGDTDGDELGGSEYMAQIAEIERGALPNLDYDLEIRTNKLVRELIQNGLLVSCHDVSSGGLAVALAESCLGVHGSIGATLDIEDYSGRRDGLMFAESGARFVVSVAPGAEEQVRKLAASRAVKICLSGVVGGDQIRFGGIAIISLEEARQAWISGLDSLI